VIHALLLDADGVVQTAGPSFRPSLEGLTAHEDKRAFVEAVLQPNKRAGPGGLTLRKSLRVFWSTGAAMRQLSKLTAVLMPAPEGGFTALNPETGTTTKGESVDEALANLRETTELFLEEFGGGGRQGATALGV